MVIYRFCKSSTIQYLATLENLSDSLGQHRDSDIISAFAEEYLIEFTPASTVKGLDADRMKEVYKRFFNSVQNSSFVYNYFLDTRSMTHRLTNFLLTSFFCLSSDNSPLFFVFPYFRGWQDIFFFCIMINQSKFIAFVVRPRPLCDVILWEIFFDLRKNFFNFQVSLVPTIVA